MRFSRVQYYTVRKVIDEEPLKPEFIDFLHRMGTTEPGRNELSEINKYIEQIGQWYGALPQHFKKEDAAERLPPPYHEFISTDALDDFGLRLYCIRLSPAVVILLNGDRKTALKVQDCKKCYRHFDFARKLSRKIDQAIQDGILEVDNERKEILVEDDFVLTI
ncbi:hypothetical protein GCM10027051_16210 [Niabella terrae]